MDTLNVNFVTEKLEHIMAKQYKLDIFKLLTEISKKNTKYFDTLSDEEIKEIAPLVLMRWQTGTNNAYQIYMLNELVNPFVFSLQKHKKLLVHLMTLCTGGISSRHKFIKRKSKKTTKMPKVVAVIKEFMDYSTKATLESLPLISNEDIISFAEQLGRQKAEMTVIKKELRTRKT